MCPARHQAADLDVEISPPHGKATDVRSSWVQGLADQTIASLTLALWDPNMPEPVPCHAATCAKEQQALDCVRTYFGMRKVDFEQAQESGPPQRLRLNGVPRYLRGALYQSYYPEGVYTAVIRRDPQERYRLRQEVRIQLSPNSHQNRRPARCCIAPTISAFC